MNALNPSSVLGKRAEVLKERYGKESLPFSPKEIVQHLCHNQERKQGQCHEDQIHGESVTNFCRAFGSAATLIFKALPGAAVLIAVGALGF